MTDKLIKQEIYKHYNLHKNTKIKLDNNKMEFRMRLGDCESLWIEYPTKIKRDIKLEKILC